MPIPSLRSDGTLPPGIYDATFDEIVATYPPISLRRNLLNAELEKFIIVLQQIGSIQEVIVDGSYITTRLEPDDVDIAIWLGTIVTPPIEAIMQQNGVDIDHLIHPWFEMLQSEHAKWVQFFSTKRDGTPKGVIRLQL